MERCSRRARWTLVLTASAPHRSKAAPPYLQRDDVGIDAAQLLYDARQFIAPLNIPLWCGIEVEDELAGEQG